MPCRVFSFRTPLAVLPDHVTLPSTLHLEPRVFGCVAYVHLHKNQRSKLDQCAIRCVFFGFSPEQKGYRCYHLPTRHMNVTMDVTFSNDELFFLPNHTYQGEIATSEDYSWFDVSTVAPNEGRQNGPSGLINTQRESPCPGPVLQAAKGQEGEHVCRADNPDEINMGKSPSGPSEPDLVAILLNSGLDLPAIPLALLTSPNKHGSAHPLSYLECPSKINRIVLR
ncbi:hypothetical protein ACFX1R_009094 [Malus domestica]